MAKRISNWKNQFLSFAGKEVLIKAVVSAMLVYVMSCLRLPGHIYKEIERLAAKVWWSSGGEQVRRAHWKSWIAMTQEKEEGGLG